MVLRAVWLAALVFQKVAPEPPPWPVGVLIVGPIEGRSKSWGGVPESCPRIPTLYTTNALPKLITNSTALERSANIVSFMKINSLVT